MCKCQHIISVHTLWDTRWYVLGTYSVLHVCATGHKNCNDGITKYLYLVLCGCCFRNSCIVSKEKSKRNWQTLFNALHELKYILTFKRIVVLFMQDIRFHKVNKQTLSKSNALDFLPPERPPLVYKDENLSEIPAASL